MKYCTGCKYHQLIKPPTNNDKVCFLHYCEKYGVEGETEQELYSNAEECDLLEGGD